MSRFGSQDNGSSSSVTEPEESRGAPKHESDLVRDARRGDRAGHLACAGETRGERLLAEDRQAALCSGAHEPRMLRRPGSDEDGVAAVEHLLIGRACMVPGRRAERREAGRVEVVRAGARHVGAAAAKRLRVVGRDETGADEADAQGFGHGFGHGRRR